MARNPRQTARAMRKWLGGLAMVGLAVGVGWYLVHRPALDVLAPSGKSAVSPAVEAPPVGAATPGAGSIGPAEGTGGPETPPERPLPSLAESDPLVRELAGGLSTQPSMVSWLKTTGIIERLVAVVDNIESGESPRPNLGFLTPKGKFSTTARGGHVYVDSDSYARYDTIADVVSSLDTPRTVALYREVQPLCEEAYRALGHPQGDFDAALNGAIRTLLATPDVTGEVELRPKVISYAFLDPRLERLTDAQKHFLRMGPRNVRLIKGQLQALTAALGTLAPAVGGATPPPPPSAVAGAAPARAP
ncbi:MAG TPA: DUF3014 domain-containing protein [Candidatus Nitrosopolaris sp.]|nr:DUF3014 domain-containing protein [Candidatus Nitrosopolaris sp.]